MPSGNLENLVRIGKLKREAPDGRAGAGVRSSFVARRRWGEVEGRGVRPSPCPAWWFCRDLREGQAFGAMRFARCARATGWRRGGMLRF